MYLFESLLILPVLEGVDEGVDGGGHPGEDGGDDVEGGHVNIVVDHVDEHQGEEADEEGDEDGEHHLGEAQVLLPLRGRHARLLAGVGRCVLLYIQPEQKVFSSHITEFFRFSPNNSLLQIFISIPISPPALSNSVENCGVAQDDCNTRQQKPEDEQKLLGGRSIFPAKYFN